LRPPGGGLIGAIALRSIVPASPHPTTSSLVGAGRGFRRSLSCRQSRNSSQYYGLLDARTLAQSASVHETKAMQNFAPD